MSRRRMLRTAGRLAYNGILALILLYLIAPSVVVVLLSFTGDRFIAFPPHSWGLDQYAALLEGGDWLAPLLRSLAVASISAVIATIVGVAATLALERTRIRGKALVQFLGIGPLLAPAVAYAVALYALFATLRMLGTPQALVLAHATMAVPFVLLITGAAITRIPPELERAAMSLGAGRLRAWRDITLPILAPALLSSAIFAFITSFDEAVVSSFLGYETLPVAIFNSVRYGVDPVIMAIATLLTLTTGGLLAVSVLLRRSK
jgi:putative spermidine/putrescine transport system permease protein